MLRSRRVIALMAMSVILASVWSGLAAAAPTVPGAVYGDLFAKERPPAPQIGAILQQAGIQDVKPNDWFAGSVTYMVQVGLMKGYSDGDFRPQVAVNRGEVATTFAQILGLANKNGTQTQYVNAMAHAGLMPSNTLPDADMSRLEIARLLAVALGIEPTPVVSPTGYPFADYDTVSASDRGLLKALYDLGIFKGYSDHGFHPNDLLTRAQLAILVDRVLGSAK